MKKGRNIINREQLIEVLSQYSTRKKLSKPISNWLQKNFLRWVINAFPHVQSVQSTEHYKVLINKEAPDWFQPKNKNIDFIFIDASHSKFNEVLDKCVEFLGSRPERVVRKFPRMTVEQVLIKWEEEHQQFLKKQKVFKETSGEGLTVICEHDGLTIVQLIDNHDELSLEMAKESALMQHCLGEFENDELGVGGYGEYYFKQIREKQLTLFSIRDDKNMPHVTISLYNKEGVYSLDQIKGKQNKPPIKRYIAASIYLLNLLNVQYDYHEDTLGMGVVYVNGKSQRLNEIKDEDTQQFLVAYKTAFIHELPNPSKATLWLAALRSNTEIETIQSCTDAMRISALLQHSLLMLTLKLSLPVSPKDILKGIQKFSIKDRTFRFLKLNIGRI